MKLNFLILSLIVISLGACATREAPIIIVDSTPRVIEKPRDYTINYEQQFSNDSVIYYPLDKPVGAVTQKFPEYRSILDNTTAGGYTVFDPSVTVYALDGVSNKPNYLPEYSVPQHAAQYEQIRRTEERKAAQIILPLPQTMQRHSKLVATSGARTPTQGRSPRLLTGY
jgi:hypothetical protein